ncbi:glucosaminidase domain-containing protein [Granulicoccus sp. GXG6511]|uniref:glucosaminidase domain-containing protein n=1 Tax=Granulicoccus sp. GXG6511 TaxID=3381351 RepID=UPI003D7E18C5
MRQPQIRLALLLISALLLLTLALNVASCQQQNAARLGPGATGLRVTAVQWLLNAHGIDVNVTGTFAHQTHGAVRGFQARSGIDISGVVDQRTFDRLAAEDAREGDRGLRVRAVQTLLHLQGNRVPVHDNFDTATEEAVAGFQKSADLDGTGIVDRETWRALFVGPNNGPAVTEADQFLATIAPFAKEGRERFGVPASVAMAQAVQETGWGRSAPGNNYFGVKCHNQSPGPVPFECQDLETGEWENGRRVQITDRFRSYASMRDSVLDYGNFLVSNSRYRPAFTVNGDPAAFARALQRAGYATDPAYADSLIAIMDQRDLYQHDR